MKKEYKKYESRVEWSKIDDISLNRERKKEKKGQIMPKNFRDALTFSQQMLTEVGRRQHMSGKVVMCSYCGEVFFAKGTRSYCYGDVCKKAEKRYRQSIVDGLAAEVKKGLYANYKLFCKYLPASGRIKIDYDLALKNGFDENAYYGTFINSDDSLWHIVGEYYFTISHNEDKRFLNIYKK